MRAVAVVIKRRMERRGMRWRRPNACAVVALRGRARNTDWAVADHHAPLAA